jgi:hypothetical protein
VAGKVIRAGALVAVRRQKRAAIRALAHQFHYEAICRRAAIDDALGQVGGRITVDLVREGARWRVAGEFDDIPRHLIRRPAVTAHHEAAGASRVAGNLDQVADMAGISETELLEFLAENPTKPKFADSLEAATVCYHERMEFVDEERKASKRDTRARQIAQRRAEGLCLSCGAPGMKRPDGTALTGCEKCRAKQVERTNRRLRARRAELEEMLEAIG